MLPRLAPAVVVSSTCGPAWGAIPTTLCLALGASAPPDPFCRGLLAVVRPGNSGGPLAPDGRVEGVVFAKTIDTADEGYALTAAEVARDARDGGGATVPVSTDGCD